MQEKVQVRLTMSWREVRRLLPRRLAAQVEPYLRLPPGASSETILFPVFEFDAADPLLALFLEAAQAPHSGKGRLSRFVGSSPKRVGPLLDGVFYFRVYETAELLEHSLIQLNLSQTVILKRPLSHYYQANIVWTPRCQSCGQVQLSQTTALQLSGSWPDNCLLAETDNYELLITDTLKEIWQAALLTDEIIFQQVETAGRQDPIVWQVQPQYSLPVAVPPTPLKVLASCPECQRPLTVTLQQDHPGNPLRETEAYLHVVQADIPPGHLWQTAVLQGRLRLPRSLLEKHDHDPEPSFVRTGRPFWVISRQLVRQFQQRGIQEWAGKPVWVLSSSS